MLWFPAGRIAIANGWLVMLGALGAVTATAPAEVVVQALGWRGLFALLAGLSALAALLVLFAVPEPTGTRAAPAVVKGVSLWAIYGDRRFWRIAPLSAVGIGTSWSLQGLWAAPWLRDVNGLERADVVQHLSVMAIAVCFSALLLGTATDRLRRRGVKTESVRASTLVLSMAAQTALVCAWPIPAYLLWAMIAAAGAATVLSFAILSEYFPKEMSGRANATLNLLHVGGAFVLQSTTGLIIEQWPAADGTYPADAHQAAMAVSLLLQLAALAWFALSTRSQPLPAMQGAVMRVAANRRPPPASASTRSATALWNEQSRIARPQDTRWRLAAAASAALCAALATALASTIGHANLVAHIVEVDRSIATTHRSTLPGATAEMTAEAVGASRPPVRRKAPPLLSAHSSAVHRTAYGLSASAPTAIVRKDPAPEPGFSRNPDSQRDQIGPKERRSLDVDQSSQPQPHGLSSAVGREAALRGHRSSRAHQQRGIRGVLSEWAHGAAT